MRALLIAPALIVAAPAMAQHMEHDHGAMVMSDDGGSALHDHSAHAMPEAEAPPAEAPTGPARAADAVWGADAMRASRAALRTENGGQTFDKLMIDRLEYQAKQGSDGYAWEAQGWIGGDLDRLWLKSEGEGAFGGKAEQAEAQALWSHAIGPWFDLQTGIRHDFAGPDRTHAVIGVQGLAPYQFEVDAAAFLSDKGDLTARVEGEVDQRITQRLIVQPRAEINLAAQDIPELGVGAGLDRGEIGVRLRYHFARKFAPYIGVSHEWRSGKSADYARARGDDVQSTQLVIGLRLWL